MQKTATVRFSFEVRTKRCVFVCVSQQKVPDLLQPNCVVLVAFIVSIDSTLNLFAYVTRAIKNYDVVISNSSTRVTNISVFIHPHGAPFSTHSSNKLLRILKS